MCASGNSRCWTFRRRLRRQRRPRRRHGRRRARKAGRRLLFHLRRGGGCPTASSTSSTSISSASLAGRRARPVHRARQPARSGQPGVRPDPAICWCCRRWARKARSIRFKPGSPAGEMTVIPPQPRAPHPGATAVLPVNYWNNGEFKDQLDFDTCAIARWRRCSPATWPRQGEGICLARRQPVPARRARLPPGTGRPYPAWTGAGASPTISTPTASSPPHGGRVFVEQRRGPHL